MPPQCAGRFSKPGMPYYSLFFSFVNCFEAIILPERPVFLERGQVRQPWERMMHLLARGYEYSFPLEELLLGVGRMP